MTRLIASIILLYVVVSWYRSNNSPGSPPPSSPSDKLDDTDISTELSDEVV